jgi:hypothetical protein
MDPGQGKLLTVSGRAKQFAGLAAKLVEVGAARKLGHDVSSQPRFAFGLGKKTVLPESTNPEQRWTQVLPANPAAPSNAVRQEGIPPALPGRSPNFDELGPHKPKGHLSYLRRRP